ncbi:hypothetical protein NPIL_627291 [Nephila pilipes]|uniref:Uncharacterized protein n=1 Tax=Nephila pilipes TaxID=299642 RepID=A0A8X6N603_NEPPI|nr:hypothetical protein NPIL_627291 [Nephila pilipes]
MTSVLMNVCCWDSLIIGSVFVYKLPPQKIDGAVFSIVTNGFYTCLVAGDNAVLNSTKDLAYGRNVLRRVPNPLVGVNGIPVLVLSSSSDEISSRNPFNATTQSSRTCPQNLKVLNFDLGNDFEERLSSWNNLKLLQVHFGYKTEHFYCSHNNHVILLINVCV